jgi:hypothetical protein
MTLSIQRHTLKVIAGTVRPRIGWAGSAPDMIVQALTQQAKATAIPGPVLAPMIMDLWCSCPIYG